MVERGTTLAEARRGTLDRKIRSKDLAETMVNSAMY